MNYLSPSRHHLYQDMQGSNVRNITVVGHSYVRRLKEYRESHFRRPQFLSINGHRFRLSYVFRGGKDYSFYNQSNAYKLRILEKSPDIVIIILGGNKVCGQEPVPTISEQMRIFHAWLRGALPNSLIITAEVEPRYSYNPLLPPDHIGESYAERRSAFNQAVKRMRDKNHMLRLATILCDSYYFTRNGVHLCDAGNKIYWKALVGCLESAFDKGLL